MLITDLVPIDSVILIGVGGVIRLRLQDAVDGLTRFVITIGVPIEFPSLPEVEIGDDTMRQFLEGSFF